MAEWLKNICLSPFKYGLNKINFVTVQAITLIFNTYGKKLLKMDVEKIIKKNECDDNFDIFYLYPLYLKQIDQDIGPNLVKIIDGVINDMAISIPWKTILTDPTIINIGNINLSMSLTQHIENIELSMIENTNSYFGINKNKIKENQDLITAYNDIHQLLTQYFNKIKLQIELLEITILDHFKIIIHNIFYDNEIINIENIYIYTLDKETNKLSEINKIILNTVSLDLEINEILIDPLFVNYLPNYYVNDKKSDLILNININFFQMEKIISKGISIIIDTNNIVIKKLSYLVIEDILIYQENNNYQNLLTYDLDKNICLFEKPINLKLENWCDVNNWIDYVKNTIKIISDKLTTINPNNMAKKTIIIRNLSTNIIYGDDLYDIKLKQISIHNTIILSEVKIIYGDINGIFNNILFKENGKILLTESSVWSNEFKIISKKACLKKSITEFNILFDDAYASNISQIVKFVTNMIDKFTINDKIEQSINLSNSINDLSKTLKTMEEKNKPYLIYLGIKNSNIALKHENIDFDIVIQNGNVCITTKSANNIVADIFMDKSLVSKIDSKYISLNSILINKFKIFIDPEIFDKINYLFGTLTPDTHHFDTDTNTEISEQGLKELHNALSRSIISHDIKDLENKLNITTNSIIQHNIEKNKISMSNTPIVKIISESFENLHTALIDDYCVEEKKQNKIQLSLYLQSLQIYFFDKIDTHKKNTEFLCAVFKEIEFRKISEEMPIVEKPLIIIREQDVKPRPKNCDRYLLKIKTGAIIDVTSRNPEWKYFIKFANNDMIDIDIMLHGNILRSSIITSSVIANIREETLLRLLAFFSNSHHAPKNNRPIYIEHFSINSFNVVINYSPIVLKQFGIESNALSIKDFKIKLSNQNISNISGVDKLVTLLGEQWKKDINPDNILQFIPNIKAIHPYTTPIAQFINLTTRYFKNARNKKRLRSITKNINRGTDMITNIVKYGVNQVWELFN